MIKKKMENKYNIVIILMVGFILRLIIMYVGLYCRERISMPYSGVDEESFYRIALQMYETKKPISKLWYTYLLCFFMHIFGTNRIVLHVINIIYSVIAALIFYRICIMLQIKKWICNVGIILFYLSPVSIFLSSALLRESLIILSYVLSLFFFLLYTESGKMRYGMLSIIISMVAVVMHSGMIVIPLTYILFMATFDKKYKTLSFSKKTMVLLVLMIIILGVISCTPLRQYVMAYFPSDIQGVYVGIQQRNRQVAGANYLTELNPNSVWELICFLPIRMLYFLFSPMPWDWRGIIDMSAFCIDSLLFLFAIIFGFKQCFDKENKRKYISALLLIQIIALATISAWGVMNAGTAMRHRNKILAAAVILILLEIDGKRKKEC